MRTNLLVRAAVLAAIGIAGFAAAFLITSRATTGQSGPGATPGAPHGPHTLDPRERAERFHPGPAWDSRGKGPWSQAELESFTDYPLFWRGDHVGGYNLQAVGHTRRVAPPGLPVARSQDAVTLIYGTCTPEAGVDRCQAPLTIHIRPACFVRPEQVPEEAKSGRSETQRGGALVQRFEDGSVALWTDTVLISIAAPADPSLAGQVIAQLRRVGRGVAQQPAASLLPPDFRGC